MPSPTWSSSTVPGSFDRFISFTKWSVVDDTVVAVAFRRSNVKSLRNCPQTSSVTIFLNDGDNFSTRETFDSVLKRLNE